MLRRTVRLRLCPGQYSPDRGGSGAVASLEAALPESGACRRGPDVRWIRSCDIGRPTRGGARDGRTGGRSGPPLD